MILVDSCLAHGSCVERETCLFQKIQHFLADSVADDTGVDKDDRITPDGFDRFVNLAGYELFSVWVVGWEIGGKRDLEAF